MAKWVITNELKPCPFCGGEAGYTWKSYKGTLLRMAGQEYWGTPEDGRTLFWVGCNNSNCFNPKTYGDKEDAFEMWNSRENKIY